jgi:isoleucyl-tRNA synthetase
VNVKDVVLTSDVAAHGRFELTVNARAAGPRLGAVVQQVIRAVKAGQWSHGPDGTVIAAGVELLPGEYDERLVSADPGAAAALPGGAGLVVLDTEVTPELAAEGWARDLVRQIQMARREAGLGVSDAIRLTLGVPDERHGSAERHLDMIKRETLTTELDWASPQGEVSPATGASVTVEKVPR